MSPGGVIAISAWAAVVYFVGYWLVRDLAAWRRTQKRGRIRPVPPRPAQGPPELWPYVAMARQSREIRDLPETEPRRTLR